MIDRFACGTYTVTLTREQSLATATCEGRFSVSVDIAPMVAGDVTTFRVYKKALPGGTVRVVDCSIFYGAPTVSFFYESGDWPNDLVGESCALDFTVEQNLGTGRAYAFKGLRDTEQIPITEPRAVFTWPACARDIVAWAGAIASNEIRESTSQQGVCSRDGTLRIKKAETSDSGSITVRGSFA